MRHAAFLAPLFLLGSLSAALAQDDRYTFEESADGVVRMDRKTGEMSLCSSVDGTLVCKLAADERTAYQDEIDRMQTSIGALEERVAKLENSLSSRIESQLPTEEEFKTTLSYMEQFLRTFMGVVKDLDDGGQSPAQSADPNRT